MNKRYKSSAVSREYCETMLERKAKEIARLRFVNGQLEEALRRYMRAYGPGYSTTDGLAYDTANGVLQAISSEEIP